MFRRSAALLGNLVFTRSLALTILDDMGTATHVSRRDRTRQKQIEDVRVVRTRLTEINRIKLVDFTLDIVVSSLQRKA